MKLTLDEYRVLLVARTDSAIRSLVDDTVWSECAAKFDELKDLVDEIRAVVNKRVGRRNE